MRQTPSSCVCQPPTTSVVVVTFLVVASFIISTESFSTLPSCIHSSISSRSSSATSGTLKDVLSLVQIELKNSRRTILHSAVVEDESKVNVVIPSKSSATTPAVATTTPVVGWDCDDNVNCVPVNACDSMECRTSLDVRIHNIWYDLSGWRKRHPAGTHWIDWYDGRDATEVMDAFHSEKGRIMYTKLPRSNPTYLPMLEQNIPSDTSIQRAFRNLRSELERTGWWKRDMIHEYKLLSIWGGLVMGAVVTSTTIPLPVVPVLLLSLSMTAAGWLGHDYVHGIDKFAFRMRNFAAIAAGLCPTWWSDKHNKHHALTNEMGVDEDIATDPFIYTWTPDPKQDSPLRKIQHYIFWIPFSFLFALWRIDSIKAVIDAIKQKRPKAKDELYALLIHYGILFTVFPVTVWLPAIFLSGLMSALIVTPTHQSESLFDSYQHDWVTAQFQSTRNAVMSNRFSEWLWGGMQYQLEHHLFPSMPRSYYPKLRTIVQQFAIANNIPGGYRESGEWEILKMNWNLYKRIAQSDPVLGAPLTRGQIGQKGSIIESLRPTTTTTATTSTTTTTA